MKMSGITWKGDSIDDAELLRELPSELTQILRDMNGFILHNGALHVRGASVAPEWHSLRAALRGPTALHTLYENVHVTDIPFAQDLLGDQFLLRSGQVYKLSSETGDVQPLIGNLDDFFRNVDEDIETFLNVDQDHILQPGQLLMAFPPFVVRTSDGSVSLKPIDAGELILFHANLAKQIRDVPDGGSIEFKVTD